MDASWLGLIELLLVFGLVGLWCWNELRVVKRDAAAARAREVDNDGQFVSRQDTDSTGPPGDA